jgi:hypothetical protein
MTAQFLQADFKVVRGMLQALTGAGGKRAAMDAAAKAALSAEDYPFYEALMKAIRSSRNRRNDFVHHLWGYSPDIPDALLLLDPKEALASQFATERYISDHVSGKTPTIESMRNNPMVYTSKDLEAAEKEAVDANSLIWNFSQCLFRAKDGECFLSRSELLQIPAIQLAIPPQSPLART